MFVLMGLSSGASAHQQAQCSFFLESIASLGLGEDAQGNQLSQLMPIEKFSLSLFPERNQMKEVGGRTFAELPMTLTHPDRPLVFIQGGLANSGQAGYNYFLMWQLRNAGYNVVSVPSQFFWRMSIASLTAMRPGESGQDIKDLIRTYKHVRHHLESRGLLRSPVNHLVGVSYGGYNAIQMSSRELDGFKIDRFVAINPPLDVFYGINFIDKSFSQGMTGLTADQRDIVLGKMQVYLTDATMTPAKLKTIVENEFTEEELRFGLASYMLDGVQEAMAVSQIFQDDKVFRSKKLTDRLAQARSWTASRYFNQILTPYALGKGISKEELNKNGQILEDVKNSRDLFLIHAFNDLVSNPQDIKKAVSILGKERSYVSECGGHVGNLLDPQATKSMIQHLNGQ